MNIKKTKINKNRDYQRVYSRGRSIACSNLVTYVLKTKSRSVRVGITTSKKIGNAVKRNRARRVIKAAFFELQSYLPSKTGFDIVFVARSKTCQVKSTEILKNMKYHLEKFGVINWNLLQ